MDKKVLIMCTGNSCRSIIGEALINKHLNGIQAYSCGVAPSGKVHINAQKVLEKHDAWNEKYYSKHLDEVIDIDFDLVITVCGHAQERCPTFPKKTPTIHVGFEDPNGKEYEAFETTYQEIYHLLLSRVKQELTPKIRKGI
jgi:arsenate reductase